MQVKENGLLHKISHLEMTSISTYGFIDIVINSNELYNSIDAYFGFFC